MKKSPLNSALFAIICIVSSAVLVSCGESIDYDGEKRLVFQTQIKNSNGTPLPNTQIEVSMANEFTPGSALISHGITDQNGKITLIFPASENDNGVNIKIYNEASYMSKEILNIKEADFENYKFVLQNAYLLKPEETVALQLTYNQTSPDQITKISINGIYNMHQELYNPLDDYYFFPEAIMIKKNQSFQLKYVVKNTQTQVETEHVVDLQIQETPLNYTINY